MVTPTPLRQFLFQWRYVPFEIQTDNAAGCSEESSKSSMYRNQQEQVLLPFVGEQQPNPCSHSPSGTKFNAVVASSPTKEKGAASSSPSSCRWESIPTSAEDSSSTSTSTNSSSKNHHHGLTLPRRAPPAPPKNVSTKEYTAPPRVPRRQVSFDDDQPKSRNNSVLQQQLPVMMVVSSFPEHSIGRERPVNGTLPSGDGVAAATPLSTLSAGLPTIPLPLPKVPTARGA